MKRPTTSTAQVPARDSHGVSCLACFDSGGAELMGLLFHGGLVVQGRLAPLPIVLRLQKCSTWNISPRVRLTFVRAGCARFAEDYENSDQGLGTGKAEAKKIGR